MFNARQFAVRAIAAGLLAAALFVAGSEAGNHASADSGGQGLSTPSGTPEVQVGTVGSGVILP